MRLRFLSIGVSIFAMSGHALAQSETPAARDTIRFTYAASDGCPTKSDFAGLVKERGVVIPENDSAPRTLSVAMNADPAHPEKWHGSLQIKDGTYLGSDRSTEGATCAEVAHSLAIFTAIALTPVPTSQPSAPATGAASTTSASPTSENVSASPPNEQPKDTYTEPDLENAPTLHRHRFALSAEGMLVFPLAQPSVADGVGISARYYLSERWGVKLDADFIRSENDPPKVEYNLGSNDAPLAYYKPADEIGGKGMLSAEFMLNRAVGTLAQGHIDLRSIPADLYLDAGIGAVWTRPLSFNDPTFRTFSYQADLAFELGLGTRVFITRSLAINFGTSITIYNAAQENTAVASTEAERADRTTWYGPSAIQFDVTARAAFEVLF